MKTRLLDRNSIQNKLKIIEVFFKVDTVLNRLDENKIIGPKFNPEQTQNYRSFF